MIGKEEFKLNSFANELNERRGFDMPKVGKRHFAYTKKGKAAATKYAKQSGKKMTKKKKY